MKKNIAKLWIKALRSGEYEQGQHFLRSADDKFCCLGVLCNLHAQAHPRIAAQQTSRLYYLGDVRELPGEVWVWAGMGSSDGSLAAGHRSLAAMNDNGKTFKELAEVIKSNWRDL